GHGPHDGEKEDLGEKAHETEVSSRASLRMSRQSAFSSLSLMLTKLYGGHGPEYLKVSSSSYLRLVSLTRSSNACSEARSTRNAALRIILSPIGLFDRLATATGLSASWISDTYRVPISSSAASIKRPSCMRAKYVELVVWRLISSLRSE